MNDEPTDEEKQVPGEMMKLLNDLSNADPKIASEAEQKLTTILNSGRSQQMDMTSI